MRTNTIVVDVSVLPIRPEIGKIKSFLDDALQLDVLLVKSIQLHNVRNQLYIEFATRDTADRFAAAHHMKHCIEQQQQLYKIPVYVDDNASDVRVHDLPPEVSNDAIIEHLNRFGEVLTIRNELWKNFFPGVPNGVRVVRMKLSQPIPSYTSVNNEETLVTYRGQIRTCRSCGQRAHSNRRCSEAKHQQAITTNNSKSYAAAVQDGSTQRQTQQWAPSPPSAEVFAGFPETTKTAESSTENIFNDASRTDSTDTGLMKRQRSIEAETAETNKPGSKKTCSEQDEQTPKSTIQSNSTTHDEYETESYRRACEEWKIHKAEVREQVKLAKQRRKQQNVNPAP